MQEKLENYNFLSFLGQRCMQRCIAGGMLHPAQCQIPCAKNIFEERPNKVLL